MRFIVNLFLLLAGAAVCRAAKVTLYEDSNFQGESISWDYEGLNCYNMPGNWNDKASSVSTHDNCFLFFEHGNCQGRMERVAPGTRSHGHLADINFNDMISSYRQCSPREDTCRSVIIDVDTSAAQDLHDFGQRAKKTMEEWYPFVCRFLYSPNYDELDRIKLQFDPNYGGVAEAYIFEKRIRASVNYYRGNPNDLGSMIHEMAHIIQQYRSGYGWTIEGIADYPRRIYYEQEENRKPDQNSKFPDPVTYFLQWVEQRWPNTIYYINKESREGTYKDDLWNRLTGSSAEDLHERMKRETTRIL